MPTQWCNDNTRQMLPKWKATTSHIFYILQPKQSCHHTLSKSMSTHPDSPATVIRTTSNVNFEQAQHIYAVATRITDAVEKLEELCSIIGDPISSRNKLLKKASFVKKLLFLSFQILSSPLQPQQRTYSQFLDQSMFINAMKPRGNRRLTYQTILH
jgi:hypothetical protein